GPPARVPQLERRLRVDAGEAPVASRGGREGRDRGGVEVVRPRQRLRIEVRRVRAAAERGLRRVDGAVDDDDRDAGSRRDRLVGVDRVQPPLGGGVARCGRGRRERAERRGEDDPKAARHALRRVASAACRAGGSARPACAAGGAAMAASTGGGAAAGGRGGRSGRSCSGRWRGARGGWECLGGARSRAYGRGYTEARMSQLDDLDEYEGD